MDKAQAINQFWSGFGWPAYDEGTVPGDATYPRITFNVATDSLGNPLAMYASLWDRGTSWASVEQKANEIAEAITKMYPPAIKFDDGRVYITKGTPFAQRMTDEDDMVRRIYVNVTTEYFSAY